MSLSSNTEDADKICQASGSTLNQTTIGSKYESRIKRSEIYFIYGFNKKTLYHNFVVFIKYNLLRNNFGIGSSD